ncbi:spore germination protein [Bacillus sp. V5-8f]|uniref:spore germination protein n=1 Tax=Bacillus sp. V5-8f TaxID=2053044 RepID=UPI0021558464|nr:spore germination protein [Bacillus sp. V5-8f]
MRYYFYIVLMNMTLNIILNVPMVLVEHRFNGSLMSILLSIPIGSLLAYLFTKGMSRFPNKDLPAILNKHLPGWVCKPFLVFLALMWIASGSFALISFSYLIKLYLMPEMSLPLISGLFVAVFIYGAVRQTTSLLYKTEITMLFAFPVVLFIIFKAMRSDLFNPVHIARMLHYTWEMPTYSSLASATYLFIGYINLAIFNKYIDSKKVLNYFWIIPVIGTGILFSSFFIPIGFFGINAVSDIVLPWIMAADSLRMELGFIERTVFLLLFFYLLMTFLFGMVTWHIGMELLKGAVQKLQKKPWGLLFLLIAGGLTILLQAQLNHREFFGIVKYWFNFRFVVEVILVVMVYLLSLRRKSA